MVAPSLGTQNSLFPARGRALGSLGNDSLAHCLLDRLQPGRGCHIKSLVLKRRSYLWAELAARSRAETWCG